MSAVVANDMPSGWELRKLGDCMRLINGRAYSQHELLDEGTPIIRIQNLNGGDRWYFSNLDLPEDKYCSRGDLLFAWSASFGPYIWNGDRSIYHYHIWRIVPFDNIDKQFAFHLLEWITERVKAASHGVAMLHMTKAGMEAWEIPLPPLEEQRRIAAILDQAETLRTQRRQALAHLDTLTQSLFLEMFGDPVVNPKGWGKRPFGTVCETRLGKMLDAKQQTGANSRRYLRNANVQWFRIETSDLLEMDFDEDARETFRLHAGDLLICEGGEPGRAAIWRGELEDVYYQKALHRGRPKSDLVNAEYLVWLLWFLSKRGGLGDYVTAATIAHLTGEKLKAMAIPVPPLALQQTFATRIQAIEALKATHRTALAQLDALFASLQQRAFAGEL